MDFESIVLTKIAHGAQRVRTERRQKLVCDFRVHREKCYHLVINTESVDGSM